MAKSSLEKALEKHQKEIERQFKKKIYAEKKLANKQRQELLLLLVASQQ